MYAGLEKKVYTLIISVLYLGLRDEIQWQKYSFTFRGLNRGIRVQCLVTTDVAELPMVSALRKSMLQRPELC